ncbi:protein artichoke [Vespula maculifrons]|uniref:Protein artichoke n=1 Tax=Vespula maculifrons TaxID=7453 RepID=A0ABD2BKN4_VESMC
MSRSRSSCITEEDLDQRRCRPTSFSTNYKSSTLNFDLNRGPVFWSHRRTSKVAMCRRGPHNLWLKRATIRLLSYFRSFDRTLRE